MVRECAVPFGIWCEKEMCMFDDIFDFGKKRSLKESIGFFIFHSILALGLMAGVSLLGA
jgi:hypothetical protein